MLYASFWVISRRLEFICRSFGTLSVPECSETSEYKLQTPGNYPKESIQQVRDIRMLSALGQRTKGSLVSSIGSEFFPQHQ
jgi:hypothetical protein